MPKRSSRLSGKRSASQALVANDVLFPPAALCDLVIHYRAASFHVHKFLLSTESTHFEAYIEQLEQGKRAYPAAECSDHPHITHCIRLPDSCGKVDADVDDFRLFLCHLYFTDNYCSLPFLVKAELRVDLTVQPPPAVRMGDGHCEDIDALLDAVDESTASDFSTSLLSMPPTADAVMSLGQYFGCDRLARAAEHNCQLLLAQSADKEVKNWWLVTWAVFKIALRFELKDLKSSCVWALGRYCTAQDACDEEWESMREQLDKETCFELMQAAFHTSHDHIARARDESSIHL